MAVELGFSTVELCYSSRTPLPFLDFHSHIIDLAVEFYSTSLSTKKGGLEFFNFKLELGTRSK